RALCTTLFPYTTLFRSLAMSDAGYMKDRVFVFQRIESRMVAKGAFGAQLIQLYISFEDDFGIGRDFQIHGLEGYVKLDELRTEGDRKSTRLNSSHLVTS